MMIRSNGLQIRETHASWIHQRPATLEKAVAPDCDHRRGALPRDAMVKACPLVLNLRRVDSNRMIKQAAMNQNEALC